MTGVASPEEIHDLLGFATELTHEAGALTLRYFGGLVDSDAKGDGSPVTLADREAEQSLRNALLGAFPEDGFLGEEFGEKPGETGYRWIIDPIDGTRNFVRRIPLWGTLVGALSIGVANKFLEPYAGAVVAKIIILILIILFIQRRPRGLFALKGRAVEQ